MARYHRMQGRPTLWLPGTDHAGIATQLVVEKMLASEGIKRGDMSREDFTARVWEWKEKYGSTITNQIKRLGASCDWSREHFTLDEQLSRAVTEAFVRLHEKGLIYQGSYMVNWSPNLQTAVSDLEVEYSEEPGFLYYIKYRVAGGSRSDFLTIATTRPETLFGDVAIAVNPTDARYSKYIGMNAIVPLTLGRHVPIIAHKYVDKDFGTGVLKISPGHDHNDYLLARKLGLPILNVMNKDGTLNEVAGLYRGLDRFEARKKVWADLKETKLAVKKEPHTSRVPRSQRGGEIIEPLVSKQWFITMEPLAEKALDAVKKGELTIIPERFEKIYDHWLSNIKDWCISRQLWWGHRIPVWYIMGRDCEEDFIVAKNSDEALEKARYQYGKDVEIYQDPDVLDTWFSSALWPFSTLGWPDESAADFSQYYPATVLETGHDILFFWVARMVMMGIEFTGRVPFKYVYLHGLIRDAQDLNLSTERLAANKAFTNKLWNAGKFILQNLPGQDDSSSWDGIYSYKFDIQDTLLTLPLPESWVISKLHLLIDDVTTSYDKFFFGDCGRGIYDFFWGDFADWYIEASKSRLYSGGKSVAFVSQAALLYVFENILKILHPFMPFVTEELWQALPHRTDALIITSWPKTGLPRDVSSIKKFENLQALTRSIRNARAEYSVEPAKRISASVVASPDVVHYISREKEVLSLLSRLELQNVSFTDSPPGDANQSVHIVASEGLEAYLPLADMVDISAELQRLSKRLSKLQTEYDGLMARLNSPNFKERAPEKIVREVQEKISETEERINLTRNQLSFLQSRELVK
uniref:valine--tRNA ligase n=1 Tax=Kalanchoe fedtschenkoi TaxID=63787 RepID=A0A7N0TGB1_KALFE